MGQRAPLNRSEIRESHVGTVLEPQRCSVSQPACESRVACANTPPIEAQRSRVECMPAACQVRHLCGGRAPCRCGGCGGLKALPTPRKARSERHAKRSCACERSACLYAPAQTPDPTSLAWRWSLAAGTGAQRSLLRRRLRDGLAVKARVACSCAIARVRVEAIDAHAPVLTHAR